MKIFKKVVFILALSAVVFSAVKAENKDKKEAKSADKGIVFVPGSWAQILKKAKAENKIIFSMPIQPWCGPCKLLQKNVFTRTDVADVFNKNFVNVKVDMESGEARCWQRNIPCKDILRCFLLMETAK